MTTIPIYILSGGQSKRMGMDKAMLNLNGEKMIEKVIKTAKSFSSEVILVTNNFNHSIFGVKTIEDIYQNCGPLAGIYTALSHSTSDKIIVLSCDIPFIDRQILHKLVFRQNLPKSIICFKDNNQIHPLIGMYCKSLLPFLKKNLEAKKLSLKEFINNQSALFIDSEESQSNKLANINDMHTIPFGYQQPKVSIVGAGPGDPDLLTIKALKAIKSAKVILHDALVHDSILDFAPDAKKIYVGKKYNNHAYSQSQINEMIVAYAGEYGHVVRLKGGDPFIFGRGNEEIRYAKSFGLEVEVIPGISSAISAPQTLGISVTERGTNESFWVITGTTSSGEISNDVRLAAQSSATVVILMGLNKIDEIVEIFTHEGKSNVPIALIQNATLQNQKSIIGNIESIKGQITAFNLGSPAVIIIGEVVSHATILDHWSILANTIQESNVYKIIA